MFYGISRGFLGGSDGKESACNRSMAGAILQEARVWSQGQEDPWRRESACNWSMAGAILQETRVWSQSQEDPWRREWLPTLVFLSGESHGQRSLAGYSPWGHKESDITEWLKLTNTIVYTLRHTVVDVRPPKWHCWVEKICVCLLPPASMSGSRIIHFDRMSSSKNFSMRILIFNIQYMLLVTVK